MTPNKRVQDTARRVVQRLAVNAEAAALHLREQYGVDISPAGYASVPEEHADHLGELAPLLAGRKVYVGFNPDEAWP